MANTMATDARIQKMNVEAEKIAFLLGELEKWRAQGLVAPEAYQALQRTYQQQLEETTRLPRAERLLEEARAASKQGRPEEAVAKAQWALELAPEHVPSLLLLGGFHEQQGRLAEALRFYEEASQRDPDSMETWDLVQRVRGRIEAQQRAHEQAQALEQIETVRQAGRTEEAIAGCEDLVRRDPNHAEARALLASLYRAQNRLIEAVAQLEQAWRMQPGRTDWAGTLRELRALQQQLEREEHQRAEEQRRQRAQLKAQELIREAQRLLEEGRWEECLRTCGQAKALNPEAAAPLAITAQVYENQRRWREAEQAWATAARMEPKQEDYQAHLRQATEKRREAERPVWLILWDKAAAAFEAFMEERNIQWMHLLGAAILLAGVIGVVVWVVTVQKLWGLVGRFVAVAVPLAATGGFYYGGYRVLRTLRVTALAFLGIASALLPIDLLMVKPLFSDLVRLDWSHYGFVVSFLCVSAYVALLMVVRIPLLVAFAATGFLTVVYSFLRSFTALPLSTYGFVFALVGFAYLLAAHQMRRKGWAPLDGPLNVVAHVVMAAALASTLLPGKPMVGTAAGAMNTALIISLAYGLSAYLFGQTPYLPVFCAVFFGFSGFALRTHGYGIEQWYAYGLVFGVVGSAFLGLAPLSRLQKREAFAAWYQWFGLAATAAVLLILFGRMLLEGALQQRLPSGPELTAGLATTLLIAVGYAVGSATLPRPPLLYGSMLSFAYAALLALKWFGRPTFEYPMWLTLIGVAMVFTGRWLHRLQRPAYANPPTHVGHGLAAVCGLLSLSLWLHHSLLPVWRGSSAQLGFGEAAWVVMLLLAGLYAFTACWSKQPAVLYPSAAAGALWWGVGCSWLDEHVLSALLGAECNYGLYFLPFVVLLIVVGRVLRRQGASDFARPCEEVAFVVALGAFGVEGYYIAASPALKHTVWITLVLYGIGFASEAVARKEETLPPDASRGIPVAELYTYLSASAFALAFFYALDRLGVVRETVALLAILVGGIGLSVLTYVLEGQSKPHWTRALLVSAGAVFAFACCYGFVGIMSGTLLVAFALVALYAAVVYGGKRETVVPSSLLGFGVGYQVVCALTFYRVHAANPQDVVHTLLVSGASAVSCAVYSWLSVRMRTRLPAYLATLSFTEAGLMALWALLVGTPYVGLHRLGILWLSMLLLLISWALARLGQRALAEPPGVVGYILSAVGIIVSVGMWAATLSTADQLLAIVATTMGTIIYVVSSVGLRNRWFLYPATVTLSIAYGLSGEHWVIPLLKPEHANYGLMFFPLVLLLAAAGDVLHRRSLSPFAGPLHHATAVLALLSLLIQPNYAPPTVFATLFVYSFLFAWASWAAQKWRLGVAAGSLSEALAYFGTACFAAGWFVLFDHLGEVGQHLNVYRSFACLTGLLWCVVWEGASVWMARREKQWWARPLCVSAFLWSVACLGGAMLWRPAPLLLPLGVVTLAAMLYTWMATVRRSQALGCWAAVAFAAGYLWLHLVPAPTFLKAAHDAVLLGASVTVAAVCMAWLTRLFRSPSFASLSTLGFGWAYFLFLSAAIDASGTAYKGWYGVGLAVLAALMLTTAQILRRRGPSDIATAPTQCGDLVSLISAMVALSYGFSGDPTDRVLGIVVMALLTGLYSASAWLRQLPAFLYAAVAALAVGWGLMASLLAKRFAEPNYGLFYLPLLTAVGVTGYGLRATGRREGGAPAEPMEFAPPLLHSAVFISLGCFVSQALYWGLPNFGTTTAATLIILSFLYAMASYLDRENTAKVEGFTYLSCAAFVCGLVSLLSRRIPVPVVCFTATGLSTAWVGLAAGLTRTGQKAWVRSLVVSAGIVGMVAVITGIVTVTPATVRWSVATLALAATVYGCMALLLKEPGLVHVAAAVTLAGTLGLLMSGLSFPEQGWILLLPLLAAALLAPVMALRMNRQDLAFWSPAALAVSYASYGLALPDRVPSPDVRYAALFAATMTASAYTYHRLSQRFTLPGFGYLSAVAGLGGYWHALALLRNVVPVPDPARYLCFYVLPYAVFLAWFVAWGGVRDETLLTQPYGAVALCLSVLALLVGVPLVKEQIGVATAALFVYAAAYASAAMAFHSLTFTYLAAATFSIGWVYPLWHRLPPLENLPAFGFWLAVLGVFWLGVALGLHYGVKARTFADPLYKFGVVIASGGAFLSWHGAVTGQEPASWAVAALLLAALVHTAMACVQRSVAFAYAANVAFILGWHALYVALRFPSATEALPVFGCWLSVLGLLQVGVGLALHYSMGLREFAQPHYILAVSISSGGALSALAATPTAQHLGQWTVAALLIAALVHTAMAAAFQRIAFVHAGFCGVLASLYLIFYKFNLRMLDLYALPIGAYLLALPALHKRVGREVKANPLYSAGLVLMLGAGLITLTQRGWQNWNSFLMLLEGVAAFLYGLSRRVRVFFFFGLGFSVAWVVVLLRDVSRGMERGWMVSASVFAILVGAGIIVWASLSERKRANLLRSLRAQVDALKEWD